MESVVAIPLPPIASEADGQRAAGQGSPSSPNDFIIGPENRLVEVVFRAVLGNRCDAYNPIVLHGPSGVGKTHLARGLVEAWRMQHRRGAMYETAVDFARRLNDAFQTNDIKEFRNRYRSPLLLVVEDLGELVTRPAAQEELLHTLDAQVDQDHRVVLTSRLDPAEMVELLPGLRSRLGAGLTVRLESPGPAAREAIVRRVVAGRMLNFTEAAICSLIEGLPGVAAELIGAINQLGMRSEVDSRAVDGEDVREYLEARRDSDSPRLRDIAAATARHFSLKVSMLRSVSRRQAVVRARGVAMYMARLVTDDSLEQIGAYFGGRDHTTVLHACRKTDELLLADPGIHRAVQHLKRELGQRPCKT